MQDKLAIYGGLPVRNKMLPYGHQWISDDDIREVVEILRSDWLTTGPKVDEFEQAFAEYVQTTYAVAVSSGTAALHAAMFALDIGKGDEVIVSPMTFAATANCIIYQGGTPVFADVDPHTLLLDPQQVEAKITPHTKAIISVDYAGQPCDYGSLRTIAEQHGLALVDDACHALGGSYKDRPVGSLADLNTFSFHPVKHITTGEGGMITTDDPDLAQRMRTFRNHGITSDFRQRAQRGSWFYEMDFLGFNYRLTDLQCALGLSQLKKLPGWVVRRREIAKQYDTFFKSLSQISPLRRRDDSSHAYHLYVIQLNLAEFKLPRSEIFAALRAEGIGVNVHYIPVHLHPFYRRYMGTAPGDCPVAETMYEQILSLPIFPEMSDQDLEDVTVAMRKICDA